MSKTRLKIAVFTLMLVLVIGLACRTSGSSNTPIPEDPEATPVPEITIPDDGRLLFEAWRVIMQDFVENDELDPRLLGDGAILGMIAIDSVSTLSLGEARDLVYELDNVGGFFDIEGGDQLREAYEVWAYAYQETVEPGELTVPELNERAIRGLVEALGDPYTSYLTASDLQLDQADLRGSFEGIGAFVATNDDGYLVVIAPLENTPAHAAGIRPGDIVLEVNREATNLMTLQEAVLKIRGPKGTSVHLLVKHLLDEEPEEITITRGDIAIDSVAMFMETDLIARIIIGVFTQRTPDELAQAIKEAKESGAQGLIIDVRRNPGGLLAETVEATGHFLNGGLILTEEDGTGRTVNWTAKSGGPATEIPLAVLIDEFSASGAEVMAGALQDTGRAILIGNLTFGKGSVTHLRSLSDGSGLYVTFARWFTPSGRLIEGEGIEPDIEILFTEADRAAQRDPQLEEAMRYLDELIASGA